MSNIIELNPAKNPDTVLEAAKGQYKDLLILGLTPDDKIDARATLGMDKLEILFLIEEFKFRLMSGVYDSD